jgi:hypothetical protein
MIRFFNWLLSLFRGAPAGPVESDVTLEYLKKLYTHASHLKIDDALAKVAQEHTLTPEGRAECLITFAETRERTLNHYWSLMTRPDIRTLTVAQVNELTRQFFENGSTQGN